MDVKIFEQKRQEISYPERPRTPEFLKRSVGKMTDEEIQSVPKIRQDHEVAMTAYREGVSKYEARINEITEEFHQALIAENGMTGHPKETKVWNLAWDDGHSSGFSEIANCYEKYADLVTD